MQILECYPAEYKCSISTKREADAGISDPEIRPGLTPDRTP